MIDAVHHVDLLRLLLVVILVDTNSVDSKVSPVLFVSQSPERVAQIARHAHLPLVYKYHISVYDVEDFPSIGQRFVSDFRIIESDDVVVADNTRTFASCMWLKLDDSNFGRLRIDWWENVIVFEAGFVRRHFDRAMLYPEKDGPQCDTSWTCCCW